MNPTSESTLDLARSLPVPNVQELAAVFSSVNDGCACEIPVRYIRPDAETGRVASIAGEDELPVIDLMKLLDPELLDEEELSRLGFACKEWGFFQLINHGIPEEVINQTKNDTIEFFKLPLKEREKVKQLPGKVEGYGQLFVQSEEQKLDWADMIILATQPLQRRDMRFWPTKPTTFRDTLNRYTLEVGKVAHCLFRLMAKDLRINPEIMDKLFSGQVQTVRINYYPPCKQASKVLGVTPHSDGSGLTVLFQVSDVHGLQIMKNGSWFSVKPQPGALIINIGDVIEIMTNGKYKSIEHRAIVNSEKERLSIAVFQNPNFDVMLRPLPELIDGNGELYRTISFKEYAREFMSGKLNGKSTLERMMLNK